VASKDIFANYDMNRVREALRNSAGALKVIDRQKLLLDIRTARSQKSRGCPA
jgi:hypothetical protein